VVGVGGAFHAAVEVVSSSITRMLAALATEGLWGRVELRILSVWLWYLCCTADLKERLVAGRSQLGVTEVIHILEGLTREWLGSSYDILNKNCTHFCDVFLRKLLPGEGCLLPPKVVRLASLADEWIRVIDTPSTRTDIGLVDTGAPPERVTISTVDEEALMIREWRQ
ncbi:hypothetical protein FOZ63_015969, partial [Perkinsus olseni]